TIIFHSCIQNNLLSIYYKLFFRKTFPQIRSEIKSRLGRLIVRYVLISDTHSVDGLFHKSVKAIFGIIWRNIYSQILIVSCSENKLFPPITKNIRDKSWIRLGTIVTQTIFTIKNHIGFILTIIIFEDT